jgi:hypothetical protein
MDNEEPIFDFMAAAEDLDKGLDNLIKAFPAEMRETLAAEYRKSPWLALLPTAADRLTAVAEHAESAMAALKDETGDGAGIGKESDGKWIVASPPGVEPDWSGKYGGGRHGFTYTRLPASK